jgi:AcrR family transcriptional regulator
MTSAWLRSDQPDVAAEKILDAAEKAFVELGVSAAGMAQIANFAGCSRGTLYRYFESRHALHAAYINRAAMRIAELVRKATTGIADPRERLVESILRSVREVRRNPGTAAWFEPGVSELAARMSRSSELVDLFTTSFVSDLHGLGKNDRDSRLRARWMVRVIVSLLAMPGANATEERALVERFVAPALLPSR